MRLIFLRHGLAEGHFSFDQDADFERELTDEGIKRLHKTFKQFKKVQDNIDVIFSSPLARAIQTAELFWSYYQESDLEMMADLDILDDPRHLVEYISFLPTDGTYVFVGHDPHITKVIAALLALHPEHDFMTIKKGGICVLEGGMWKGFTMELLISPKFLRTVTD
ncbi:SixA phosphatase family protein [Peredibacter sp. HCB2-198]|uniref:SixA phosphatase family protein n=1 Tax=Peredibacter sp. HCB2-198 TaxID=3383025 RepID=UPI0038B54BAB